MILKGTYSCSEARAGPDYSKPTSAISVLNPIFLQVPGSAADARGSLSLVPPMEGGGGPSGQ